MYESRMDDAPCLGVGRIDLRNRSDLAVIARTSTLRSALGATLLSVRLTERLRCLIAHSHN